jgi:hypothetical protein
LILFMAVGCAQPVAGVGHDMATGQPQGRGDLAGVDLLGMDLASNMNCPSGEHGCNGSCIPDVNCCSGADCPQYANSTATCTAGMCSYNCNSGFRTCAGSCRSTMLCCADSDCPPEPNVMTAHCSSTGQCSIGMCNAGYYDLDKMVMNGCECQDGGKGQACAMATAVPNVGLGGSQMVTGNLPGALLSNWFSVTFSGSIMANYHPHVVLSTNPGKQFLFDVVADCNEATQACGTEAGLTANTITDWEVKQTGGDPGSKMYAASPVVGVGGNVKIHVYRAPGGNVTCDSYTLTITN